MDRFLVTHLSSFELALVMIAVFLVPGLLGIWAIRRWAPGRSHSLTNDVTGVVITFMAAVYGVILAFAIIVLYQQFRAAEQDVHAESGALSNLYRSSQELPPSVAVPMKSLTARYVSAVTGPEWDAMAKNGGDTQLAWAQVNDIYRVMGAYAPATEKDRLFDSHVLDALAALVDARRARLDAASASLPAPFMVLLFGGGFLLLAFNLIFDIRDRRYHAFVVTAVAVLIGFSLMLCISLEFPFSGGVRISSQPFEEGGLGNLHPGA